MFSRVQKIDLFMALPIIASMVMISEFDTPSPDAIAISAWDKGIVLGILTIGLSVLVAAASALDRRCSEEYLFQIMANAALVAMAATMLVNLGWVIGEKAFDLPELASDNILGVSVLAWALAYYWFRAKGISQ